MKKLLALLLALAFLAAACGSDDTTDSGSADAGSDDAPADDASADGEDSSLAADDGDMIVDDHCESAKVPGTLTVATGDPVFPPWIQGGEGNDPTTGEGFESAIVYAVAGELGYEVQWVRTTFEQGIAPGAKEYDFNVQQYSINAERENAVDFSTPYYLAQQAIITTNPAAFEGVESIADLKELKLGAAIGTTSLNYIEDTIVPTSAAAVYDDNVAAKAAFDAGQLDGLVLDVPTAYYVSAVEIDGAELVGILPEVVDGADALGFVFEEGSEFTPCVNGALETLRGNGTLDDLADTWLNQTGDIPTFTN